jgi:2,4-dienoyl-CoA reductase-like NADH-dependent reductase (Old Yellow Enzyme family)
MQELRTRGAPSLFTSIEVGPLKLRNRVVNEAIAEGRADLIAFGKPFIANPDLVIRLFLDAPLMPINRDTLYGGSEQGYADYPILRAVAPDACYHDADGAWG